MFKTLLLTYVSFDLMEYITLRLDSTNEVEQWYVRHNYFYCLITKATCFDLYTGHLQAFFYR